MSTHDQKRVAEEEGHESWQNLLPGAVPLSSVLKGL